MGLFDNEPLTDDEVSARGVCECTHTYGQHRGGTNCTACACEEFAEVPA
jgi:hypothetical protein